MRGLAKVSALQLSLGGTVVKLTPSSDTKHEPIRWSYYYACRYLVANGPATADMVGAAVWKGKKRGKTTSSGGGGDYAAQMLLGRMKKAGLVQHARFEGATRWEVTPLGRAEAAK